MRKATIHSLYMLVLVKFQSPPSVRKATDELAKLKEIKQISIPAFREEGDFSLPMQANSTTVFQSPQMHFPAFREEGDPSQAGEMQRGQNFNPRLP